MEIQTNSLLWTLRFWILLLLMEKEANTSSSSPCGGRLTASRGIISTPNFPDPFPVPIKCQWVIDVSDFPTTNGTIVVYLTQLYVYKGLRFTEYAYYESDTMNYGVNLLQEVTEGNVFEHKWLRTFRPFLVLEFELERLEGNHVRVLDDLLDVYGFNITYEMTENNVNPKSCSVKDCSFAGNCLLSFNYEDFWCECFESFSGEKCNDGPLCYDDRNDPICENGATCQQIGAKAVECVCPAGFTGVNCKIQLSDKLDSECTGEQCVFQCPYDERKPQPCNCKNGTRIYHDKSRYECRIKLSNITSHRNGVILQHGDLESYVAKQLARYMRNSNISSMEDLKILSITPMSEVTFHFFGNTDDGDKIRESLNRLVQRRRLSEISLESTHFTFQQKPALNLQSLHVSPMNEIHVGDQLTLRCMAQGSYSIVFTWYNNNMLVNVSKATRGIRYRNLQDDGSNVHTSVLTIEKATIFDSGHYTCQVSDWDLQQCKSIFIEVKNEPDIKVIPMSITVNKGSNVQLTCMTPNMRSIGIGFGWTKNRALLKLEPGSEVWEDLYPAGSMLKITNLQKSTIYTCNVAHKSMSVRVEVVNRTLIPICLAEKSWGLSWPDTAPGSEALLACPRHFVGNKVSRLCSMKDATTPEWQIPDFSECLYEPLLSQYNNFQSLTMGYQSTTGSETINMFWEILRTRDLPLYSGEGDRILNILSEIKRYQYNIEPTDLYHANEALTRILNRILDDENSILTEQKLSLLLKLMQRNLEYWSDNLNQTTKHLTLSSVILDIREMQIQNGESITHSLQIPAEDLIYPKWYNDKVAIRLWKKRQRSKTNNTISAIVIVYKNITQFLPTTYLKELDDGTDLEYRINSRVITVATSAFVTDKHNKIWIDLQLRHLRNQSGSWNVSCGLMNDVGSWDLDKCIANTLAIDSTTQCLCPSVGTIAIFLTARAVRVMLAKKEQTVFIVLCGCGSCAAQCILSLIIVGIFWWKNPTWLNFLKIQCCLAIAGAMAVFMFAAYSNLPESSYSLLAIALEAFLLVGMSAPISQALLIYAELTHIRPSQHLQPTVIAVITGVPILAILSAELTHKSTGWRHESWWLIYGSGVYNIFVVCNTMMFLIFILLYMGSTRKAHALRLENVMKKETIENRLRMLHCAAIIICGIIVMEISSLLYINSSSIIHHYIFASLSSVLGFLVLTLYVIISDIKIISPFFQKFRWELEAHTECTSEPVKGVCSKSEPEMENNSATPAAVVASVSYLELRGVAAGSINLREIITEASTYPKQSTSSATSFLPKIRIDHSDDINLENYNTSPRKYQDPLVRYSPFNIRISHYHVNDYCSFQDYDMYREQPRSSTMTASTVPLNDCSGKVLCSADVESRLTSAMPDVTLAIKKKVELLDAVDHQEMEKTNKIPDIANTTERKQPDGEENAQEISVINCEAAATRIIDRISHDLDYLLNRNGDV
ncbi:uncharacterized protein [Prorops nasuta]|uniref:uncharacterized protein n=1 Tax=Prorops nasuta TaxID=863751 RepID=UPI0034CEE7C8